MKTMNSPDSHAGKRPVVHVAAILGVLAVGFGLREAILAEAPLGRVGGFVEFSDLKQPAKEAEVYLSPHYKNRQAKFHQRVVTADADGHFLFGNVPAGEYHLSATTNAHRVDSVLVTVEEGKTSDAPLHLERSEPELRIQANQRKFGTQEATRFRLTGYVDPQAPKGKDAVQYKIYKLRLSNILLDKNAAQALEEVGRSYDQPTSFPQSLLKPTTATPPTDLGQKTLALDQADREGFYNQRIDMGRLTPGLYMISAHHGKAFACTWLLVSDLALVTKRAEGKMLAYTAGLVDGQPIPGAEVRIYRGGKIIDRQTSGQDGLARLAFAQKQHEGDTLSVAVRGLDEAVVSRDYYSEENDSPYAVHVYTDRPVYRPGHVVQFKGVVRRTIDSGAVYRVASALPVPIEVRDPGGEIISKQRLTCSAQGSFSGSFHISSEAPPGAYTLISQIDGHKHTQDIQVAAYEKPEFEIKVDPAKPRFLSDEMVEVNVRGEYYFGSPLAGAKFTYHVYRNVDWSSEYPDDYGWEEDEGGNDRYYSEGIAYGEGVADGEGELDDNGRAIIKFDTGLNDKKDTPQAFTYEVWVSLSEEGRNEVSATASARVVMSDLHVAISPSGYLSSPGIVTPVTVTVTDHDKKPIANHDVVVKLEYEKWKKGKYEVIPEGELRARTGPDGKAVLNVLPSKSGDLRLTLSAVDGRNRTAQARASLWVTRDQDRELDTEYPNLSLVTDKRRYLPGDTARVLINSDEVGQTVLVTVEGNRIYHAQLVPIRSKSTVFRMPVKAEYGQNVYLSACYVRKKKFANSTVPIRVDVPSRSLTLEVTPDKTGLPEPGLAALPLYAPRETVTYHVQAKEANGKPAQCEFSLGVVDESIYAIREDDPSAIRDTFYPHRYNRVSTSYSFAAEYLGPADKSEPKIEARTKFPDTAYWNPTLRTDANGQATVTVRLPDTLTTWRATAIAHSPSTALGWTQSKVRVSLPFFVRLETPRFMTERDQTQILASVHNETATKQTALVKLACQGLTLKGSDTQTIELEPGQIGRATWQVEASTPGDAQLRVTAWTPKVAGVSQFTDGVEKTLPVRLHARQTALSVAGRLNVGKVETEILRLQPEASPIDSRLVIRITPSVASSLSGALEYLVGYPYGCVEQTMSRFLPDVVVSRLGKQLSLPLVDASTQAELPKMVNDGLARLYRMQHSSGAWGWWQYDEDDAWMTSYVLYGLSEARKSGYPVSTEIVRRGREALVKMLPTVRPGYRAFATYALAVSGERKAVMPSIELLKGGNPSALDIAYTALAQQEIGQPSAAAEKLRQRVQKSSTGAMWGFRDNEYFDSEGSMSAVCLRALLAEAPNDPLVDQTVEWLMRRRTGSYWSSTRDTSAVMLALCDYLAKRSASATGAPGQIVVKLNGQLVQTVPLGTDARREKEIVVRVPAGILKLEKNELTMERTGGTGDVVFYSAELHQAVKSEEMGPNTGSGIRIAREYLRVVNKRSEQGGEPRTEPTGGNLRQGDQIMVRLTVECDAPMEFAMLEDALPAGLTPSVRGEVSDPSLWRYLWSEMTVRDDRVTLFFRSLGKEKHVIEYFVRAETLGEYHSLPATIEEMYKPERRGESREERVTIR